MIDLHWIDQFTLATASAVVATCAPVLLVWLKSHLRLAGNVALSNDLDNAITAGTRIALDELRSVAAHNQTEDIRNKAISKGVSYALTAGEAAIGALGITPKNVASLISGELAHRLGETSSKPVTPPAPAPASSPVAQPTT